MNEEKFDELINEIRLLRLDIIMAGRMIAGELEDANESSVKSYVLGERPREHGHLEG